jgi:hypothetical protein
LQSVDAWSSVTSDRAKGKDDERHGEDADHGDDVDDPVAQFHGVLLWVVVGAKAPGFL